METKCLLWLRVIDEKNAQLVQHHICYLSVYLPLYKYLFVYVSISKQAQGHTFSMGNNGRIEVARCYDVTSIHIAGSVRQIQHFHASCCVRCLLHTLYQSINPQ